MYSLLNLLGGNFLLSWCPLVEQFFLEQEIKGLVCELLLELKVNRIFLAVDDELFWISAGNVAKITVDNWLIC